MIKIVDKRCNECEKVYQDIIDEDFNKCECGGKLERLFTLNKDMQMLGHWNEHMGHTPVYINDREHFKKEIKKRGLEEVQLKKPKNIQYYT